MQLLENLFDFIHFAEEVRIFRTNSSNQPQLPENCVSVNRF